MPRRPLEGSRRITGDAFTHSRYGVGPATDYGADEGEYIRAPFAGVVSRYWSSTGGNTVVVDGDGATCVMQHLSAYRGLNGLNSEGTLIGEVGNTGSATDGPHLHTFVILDNGTRMTLEAYLARFGYTETPLGARTSTLSPAGSTPQPYKRKEDTDMRAFRQTGLANSGIIISGAMAPRSLQDGVFNAQCATLGLTPVSVPKWQYDTAVREGWVDFQYLVDAIATASSAGISAAP